MKFHDPKCPKCGELAKGTQETLAGCALVKFGESGEAEWEGETEVFWDEQKTDTCSETGGAWMVCHCGHCWVSSVDW